MAGQTDKNSQCQSFVNYNITQKYTDFLELIILVSNGYLYFRNCLDL